MGGRGSSMGAGASGGINRYDPSYDSLVNEQEIDNSMGLGNSGVTDKWQNNLSDTEKAEIKKYTHSSYSSINKSLRENQIDDFMQNHVDTISDAINKYDLDHPITVERGSSLRALGLDKNMPYEQRFDAVKSIVGNVIHDKGFTSTSMLRNKGFNNEQIKMHIKIPKGKGIGAYVKGISRFGYEYEFLLNKGSGFRVDGVYLDANNKINVNMTYAGKA